MSLFFPSPLFMAVLERKVTLKELVAKDFFFDSHDLQIFATRDKIKYKHLIAIPNLFHLKIDTIF